MGPVDPDASRARAVPVLHEHCDAGGATDARRHQRDDEHGDIGVEDGGALQHTIGVSLRGFVVGQGDEEGRRSGYGITVPR